MAPPPKKKEPLNLSVLNVGVADALEGAAATHIPKLSHARNDCGRIVRNLKSATRDLRFSHGICSVSIESPYAYGFSGQAGDNPVAQALSTDLGEALPGSVLGGLQNGQNIARLPATIYNALQHAFNALTDCAPETVSQFDKIVYFETPSGETLITPMTAAKMVHETNRRLAERRAAYFESETRDRFLAPVIAVPVGGANPSNVSYVVVGNTRNTNNGALQAFKVLCPVDRRTPLQILLSRLFKNQTYVGVGNVEYQDLWNYGARADIAIGLATHRNKEAIHAFDIAHQYVARKAELEELLTPVIAKAIAAEESDEPDVSPFAGFNDNEAAWLRGGEFDKAALAAKFAKVVARMVERRINRKREDGREVFLMPDRSFNALVSAFEEVL